MYRKYTPHLLLLVVQLCFSGWHVLSKVVLERGTNALAFALVREVVASVLMYVNVKAQGFEINVHRDDIGRFVFLGFCSFVNVVGCILALMYITSTRFAVMQPSVPVIAAMISVVIGMEKLNIYKGLGMMTAVTGAFIVELGSGGAGAEASAAPENTNLFLGTAFTVAQCICMASLIVFQKPLLAKYSPPVLTFVYYSVGALITLITCFFWATSMPFKISDLYFDGNLVVWSCLFYAAIFATLFTYNAYSYVSTIVTPSIVTIYSCAQPAWTSILAFLLYGSVITSPEALGGTLIAIGLALSVKGAAVEQQYDPTTTLVDKKDELNDIESSENGVLLGTFLNINLGNSSNDRVAKHRE